MPACWPRAACTRASGRTRRRLLGETIDDLELPQPRRPSLVSPPERPGRVAPGRSLSVPSRRADHADFGEALHTASSVSR